MAADETSKLYVLLSLFVLQASCFDLRITPLRAHLLVNTRIKIMCQADAPLTACQFKRTFSTSVYDLSRGPRSTPHADYDYYGVGLEHGQCGINLREYIKDHTYDVIGCRVKTENGGWKYAYMSLVVSDDQSLIFNMDLRESVVLPGSDHSVVCRAGEELSTCQMKWAGQSWTVLKPKAKYNTGVAYFGAGVEKGQCGITFFNVTDKINGNVFCAGWTKSLPKGYEMDTSVIIVAKAPDPPMLALNKVVYNESDVMTASCNVNNSRPVANITWYFDVDVIRNDTVDETTDDSKWRWSYDLQQITQSVTRKLTWEDDGKELVCRAGHLALKDGVMDYRQVVTVQYAPRSADVDPPLLRAYVGGPLDVRMAVFANPQPSFQWQVGTLIIGEGQTGDGGRITASEGVKVENAWVVTLTISTLTLNDTESDDIVLTAWNLMGELTYRIPFNSSTATASSTDVEYLP